jgi:predicted nucleic acid-binding protein
MPVPEMLEMLVEMEQGIGMELVYLETSFISYLVARPSRNVIVAGHQQTTQDWWANRRREFDCVISQVVIDEASAGDAAEAQKRLDIIAGLPELEITADAEALAEAIMASGILPSHVARDAAHVAVAAVHDIAYLLTWNCKHLANAQISRRIAVECAKAGYRMPIICTPEELMGE